MVEVEQCTEQINAPEVITRLLRELSAVTDYHVLQDSLPRYLTTILHCRCVLFYQRIDETLQFVAGSFDNQPGWSSALLSVAHINPINLTADMPEACAWRERRAVVTSTAVSMLVALPLIYRQRGIGVVVLLRRQDKERRHEQAHWADDEILMLEAIAGVIALLLENSRLLQRDRERIHELSLINSISSQMNCALYDVERMRAVLIQRTREISVADLCEFIEPSTSADASSSWLTPEFQVWLFRYFNEQSTPAPLLIERPGEQNNPLTAECLDHLPENIKTFFAFPLLSSRAIDRRGRSLSILHGSMSIMHEWDQEPGVPGIIVGAYHHPWKLRRAEIVLLHVLANQASTVLANIHLMAEVLEARNEARKLLRQVLEDQRLKELILESIPSGLITADRQGYITTFNRAAAAILGYLPSEAMGKPLRTLLAYPSSHTAQKDAMIEASSSPALLSDKILQALHSGVSQSGTIAALDRHQHEIMLDIDVLPLRDAQGEHVGTLVTFTDVTSVHRLEEEKRRLDRLATLGEMAANVAHEVRNPLASIKTSMQMLMEDLVGSESDSPGQSEGAQESITVVLKEVERLDTIVRELLLFARPHRLHRVKCHLPELSDHILQLIQAQCMEANVVVHRDYQEVPPIWIDVAQMEQVLLNLYINSLQAMPDGGTLTVSCRVLSSEKSHIQNEVPATSEGKVTALSVGNCHTFHGSLVQSWLELSASDTGVGIPPDQLERIFQPFFTTKAHGIGLGLAITRRLVEDHGGYIHVEGHPGYGATLSIRLPLTTEDKGLTCDDES